MDENLLKNIQKIFIKTITSKKVEVEKISS